MSEESCRKRVEILAAGICPVMIDEGPDFGTIGSINGAIQLAENFTIDFV